MTHRAEGVSIIAGCYFLSSVPIFMGACAILFSMVVVAMDETSNDAFIAIMFMSLGLMPTLLLGGASIITALGLLRRSGWARVAGIVLALPYLILFPFGTLVAILVIAYLMQPEVIAVFEGKGKRGLDYDDLFDKTSA